MKQTLPNDQYANEGRRLKIYHASWRGDNQFLPEDWYHEALQKQQLHCICWSSGKDGLYEENIEEFQNLLERLTKYNLTRYTYLPTIGEPYPTTEKILKTGLEDSVVIFYSGQGVKYSSGAILPVVAKSIDTQDFWKQIEQILCATKGHVFVLFDIQGVAVSEENIAPLNFLGSSKLVFLQNVSMEKGANYFFRQFIDIVRQTGASIRYSDLFTRLQIRFRTDQKPTMPTIEAYNHNTAQTWLFSGITPHKKNKRVYYHEEVSSWVVDSGSEDGITPSNGFMDTLFRIENGPEVKIESVAPGYSIIEGFREEDTENTFTGFFVQRALPKMKITYSSELPEHLLNRFQQVYNQHSIDFFDVTTNVKEANFLIKSKAEDYFLTKNTDDNEIKNRPLFFYQKDVFEFFKQIEYIAKWNAVVELDNPQNTIPPDLHKIVFETIEGPKITNQDGQEALGATYVNPTSIDLNYRNKNQPYFKCKVTMDSSEITDKYFIAFLYLDTTFGIMQLDVSGDGTLSAGQSISIDHDNNKLMSAYIEEEFIKIGITKSQDFLLVFISKEKMDIGPLVQDFLQLGTTVNQATDRKTIRASQGFVLPQTDWAVRKIPVNVIYDSRDFKTTVMQLLQTRPVKIPSDLHKNRWGGYNMNNGFVLSAMVLKNPVLWYEVRFEVRRPGYSILDGGEVAILLHDSFLNPVRFEKFQDGLASITVTAYEDFTAAAILYDGSELELDLSELAGLPRKFYAHQPSKKFIREVAHELASRPIVQKEDLQKGRWGGLAEKNGWKISANVYEQTPTHKIILTLVGRPSVSQKDIAFLLHDSFEEQLVYSEVTNGISKCIINSYEAFTVGVYIDGKTQLELDLNQQKGFPETFYY